MLGEDPRDIHRLFRKLQLATSGAGSVAGIVYNAISGIEAALWDVLGQWLDVPIYRLLGGKFRDEFASMPIATEAKLSRVWMKCCVPAPRRGSRKIAAYTPKDYFGEGGEDLLLRPTTIAARLCKKEQKDSPL